MGLIDKMSHLGRYKTVKDAKKGREVVKREMENFWKGKIILKNDLWTNVWKNYHFSKFWKDITKLNWSIKSIRHTISGLSHVMKFINCHNILRISKEWQKTQLFWSCFQKCHSLLSARAMNFTAFIKDTHSWVTPITKGR